MRLSLRLPREYACSWCLGALRLPFSYGLPVVLGLVVSFTMTRGQLAFNTDSIFYWSAARTLALDGRLSTGIAYDERQEPSFQLTDDDARAPRSFPLTVFAPGYPVALASVATCLGQSISFAAWLVNMASAIAIISLAVAFGRRVGGASSGWCAGALVAVLPFFQGTMAIAASEPLFTALVLFALLLLIRWLEHPDGSAFNIVGAALLGAAATYTRYIGVSFALVFSMLVARNFWQHPPPAVRRYFPVVSLCVHCGLIIPLFVRNLILTGRVGGAERSSSDTGLMGNLGDLGIGLFHALPLVRTPISGPFDLIASGLIVATATAGSMILAYRMGALCSRRQSWSLTSCVLGSFIVVYCLLLVILRSRVAFEVIDLRLLFPVLVCLTVLIFATLGWRLVPGPRLATVAVLIAVSFTATVADATLDPTVGSLSSDRERDQPLIRWAERAMVSPLPPATVVFADDIWAIHFATGWPIRVLPSLSSYEAMVSARRVSDRLFIIGPPGPRSLLTTPADRDTFERALYKSAVQIQKGERYSVWCLPGTSSGARAIDRPGTASVRSARCGRYATTSEVHR